jgi:hypothetical protein
MEADLLALSKPDRDHLANPVGLTRAGDAMQMVHVKGDVRSFLSVAVDLLGGDGGGNLSRLEFLRVHLEIVAEVLGKLAIILVGGVPDSLDLDNVEGEGLEGREGGETVKAGGEGSIVGSCTVEDIIGGVDA